jgi:hypothetical protein
MVLGKAVLIVTLLTLGSGLPASARFEPEGFRSAVGGSTDNEAAGSTSTSVPKRDANGIVGRRVVDVVRQQQAKRSSGAAQSISPEIAQFADDPTAYLDEKDRVFIAEFAELMSDDAESPEVAHAVGPQNVGDAFALNSRPGSTKTVYLDFDGAVVTNSAWNFSRNLPQIVAPPFDRDGSPATFSAAERQFVIDVWRGVAEDFAPFDVNITTQLPSADALAQDYFNDPVYGMNVVVTPYRSWVCDSCAGIAYVDVFSEYPDYAPAWAFPSASVSALSMGSVISHEVGHNLGLRHDGVINGSDYYGGHGNWSPIMGFTTKTFTQWSKGEYSNANQLQNDLGQIGVYLGSVEDTDGGSFSTASQLGAGPLTTQQTTIRSSTDVDFWSIIANNGYLKATVTNSGYAANLLAKVSIYTGSGQLLDSRTMTPGVSSVSIEASGVSPGTYFAVVESGSWLTPFDGFSTYGSIGLYTLSIETVVAPRPPLSVSLSATGDRVLSATWPASLTPSGLTPLAYSLELCEGASGPCLSIVETTSLSYVFSGLDPAKSFRVSVRTKGPTGLLSDPMTTTTVQVKAKPSAPLFGRVQFDESNRSLKVQWCCVTGYAPIGVSTVHVSVTNPATSEVVTMIVPSSDSQVVFAIPQSWGSSPIVVSGFSRSTATGTVWEISDLVSSGPLQFGRTGAVQSAPTGNSTRGGASAAETTSSPSGRGAAPQA